VKYKGKDAVLGEMKTHDKFASLFMRVIRQNDKTVTCEVAVNQSLPETCFFDAV